MSIHQQRDHEYEVILLGDPCAYCGDRTEEIDHVRPVIDGGGGDWANLTAACRRCNRLKHRKTLLLFLLDKVTSDGPPEPSPCAGVVWRRDLKCWAAYVDCVRRYQLGHHPTAAEAQAAVEAWWAANPDAMSPRARRRLERLEAVRELWAQDLTLREIADRLGITQRALLSFFDRERRKETPGLPRVGRGGPGKRRPSRGGVSQPGRGYRYSPHSSRPWLVQVQASGKKFTARYATETGAKRAVSRFRREHPKPQRKPRVRKTSADPPPRGRAQHG